MKTQKEKSEDFVQLHGKGTCFVVPNPWDVGSARLLEHLGFKALATDRIRNAAHAARSLDFKFTLTARAENYLYGRPDVKDTIRRLQAYQDAGADVLFAPGITSKDDIRAIVSSVDRPLDVIMGFQGIQLTVAELQDLGVARISLGGSLARAAYSALMRAALEVQSAGTFGYANEAISGKEINGIFSKLAV